MQVPGLQDDMSYLVQMLRVAIFLMSPSRAVEG